MDIIKRDIADFITLRDNGVRSNSNDIFLTAGGIHNLIKLVIFEKSINLKLKQHQMALKLLWNCY